MNQKGSEKKIELSGHERAVRFMESLRENEDYFDTMGIPADKKLDARSVLDAIDLNVITPICYAHSELLEIVVGLTPDDTRKANDLLTIQNSALMLYQQIAVRAWHFAMLQEKEG